MPNDLLNPYFEPRAYFDSSWRKLPHRNQEGKIQFATFHLADSLPATVVQEIRSEKEIWLKAHPRPWDDETTKEYHNKFTSKIEYWLDQGFGDCTLKDIEVAEIMKTSILHFNNIRYLIHAYVVMSNHVHVLVEPLSTFTIRSILQSWKSFTSTKINKHLGRQGQFWHQESFDRLIRSTEHYNYVIRYINRNIEQGGILWQKGEER